MTLDFGDGLPVEGVIRWADEDRFGIAFDEPIDDAQLNPQRSDAKRGGVIFQDPPRCPKRGEGVGFGLAPSRPRLCREHNLADAAAGWWRGASALRAP